MLVTTDLLHHRPELVQGQQSGHALPDRDRGQVRKGSVCLWSQKVRGEGKDENLGGELCLQRGRWKEERPCQVKALSRLLLQTQLPPQAQRGHQEKEKAQVWKETQKKERDRKIRQKVQKTQAGMCTSTKITFFRRLFKAIFFFENLELSLI